MEASTAETAEQRQARESAERSAAARKPQEVPAGKPGPDGDGAKPGAAAPSTAGDRYGYDADARATERESADIVLGGKRLRRVRKTWDVSKEQRQLLRRNEKVQDKAMRLEAVKDAKGERIRGVRDIDTGNWVTPPLMEDAEVAAVEAEIEAVDQEIDALAEEGDQIAYDIIRLGLRFADGQEGAEGKPTDEFLKQHLAAEDAAELVRRLTRGAEPDPTPQIPSS